MIRNLYYLDLTSYHINTIIDAIVYELFYSATVHARSLNSVTESRLTVNTRSIIPGFVVQRDSGDTS